MDPSLRERLYAIYAEVEEEIRSAGPVCEASGRCCRFVEFGHTLFLSRLEADALFAEGLPEDATATPESCPYQKGRLCQARDRRPLGCRVYFCDPSFADRQSEIMERYVRRLKQLHEESGCGWHYQPLDRFVREALREAVSPKPTGVPG